MAWSEEEPGQGFCWFCCGSAAVIPDWLVKRSEFLFPGFRPQELPPKILLVKVPKRNNVAVPNGAVPSKNKSWRRKPESCKNHNIERDLKGTKNLCNA